MDPDLSHLVVMRMDADPPSQHPAQAVGGQGELMVLKIDARLAWTRGENLLVVAGEPGRRMFLQAAYVAPSGKFHMLRRASHWRQFDARTDERFAARFPARVRARGGWKAEATVVDISAGGLAVHVAEEPPHTQLQIDVTAGRYRSELPVEVRSRSDTAEGPRLHCRFELLSPAQTAFVRAVIADLAVRRKSQAA